MLNTDAESVEDIVAARSIDTTRDICMSKPVQCDMKNINSPVSTVVSNTPAVDNKTPGDNTGFISDI